MILLYLDPGTGSLLIQFTIAAISALFLFYKQIKLKIKHLYYHISGKPPEAEE
jgi:hypothetical protein